jgi:hypothetical protein
MDNPCVQAWIQRPEALDDGWVRLGVALSLCAAAVTFFRQAAVPGLAASALGAAVMVTILYVTYHYIGIRTIGPLWPGASRGLAVGLLLFCLCPPGLPPWLMFSLAALAVLVEGALSGLPVPLALSGVLILWPLAWLWHVHSGLGYVGPFQLRPQFDPTAIWTRFQLEVDPLRLYTGNVAGPLGATSFGLSMIGFVLLAYIRKVSWAFLLVFFCPIAVAMAVTRQSLPTYLISGAAVVFAGLVAAETRKLPPAIWWKVGAGLGAGLLSALLLLRGAGYEAYGAGVLGALLVVSLFQLFGLAGSPAVIAGEQVKAGQEVPARVRPGRLAALVVLAPAGLALVWRDEALPRTQRQVLAGLGVVLYLAAIGGALLWLWLLRLPA